MIHFFPAPQRLEQGLSHHRGKNQEGAVGFRAKEKLSSSRSQSNVNGGATCRPVVLTFISFGLVRFWSGPQKHWSLFTCVPQKYIYLGCRNGI